MKRLRAVVGTLAISWMLIAVVAVGLPISPGTNRTTEWPFGNDPQDAFSVVPQGDFVVTIGTSAWAPGSAVLANIGAAFKADPFFTRAMTELAFLPTFAASQSLETGMRFDWWSASVGVDLSLEPWALASAGGWFEVHPPTWMIAELPVITLDTGLGWGPQWTPLAEWSHELAGHLDVQAGWVLSTFWDSPLGLVAASDLSAAWTFPSGDFVPNWHVSLDAASILTLFPDSTAALRAGVAARVFIFPVFEFGFDIQLELRANVFYAYGLVGAGASGIRAEVGAAISFGLNLFGEFSAEVDES